MGIFAACDVLNVNSLNENMYTTYNFPFYLTDKTANKRLIVLNLPSNIEHVKQITPNTKNFELKTQALEYDRFKGVRYFNKKMVGQLKKQIIDLTKPKATFSPFMRYYLKKQASYTIVDSFDKQYISDILEILDPTRSTDLCLIINDSTLFLEAMPLINLYNNIKVLILRDLQTVPQDYLESTIKSNILETNKLFMFFNTYSETSDQFSRLMVPLLRENNTLGEFYYTEYDAENPELFYLSLFNMISD